MTRDRGPMAISPRTHNALAAFDRAPDWLDAEPLTAEALRGHARSPFR